MCTHILEHLQCVQTSVYTYSRRTVCVCVRVCWPFSRSFVLRWLQCVCVCVFENLLRKRALYRSHILEHLPDATHCNTLPRIATRCNTLQHIATQSIPEHIPDATHCYPLQPTGTHCNSLQLTATHCNTKCCRTYSRRTLTFLKKLQWQEPTQYGECWGSVL